MRKLGIGSQDPQYSCRVLFGEGKLKENHAAEFVSRSRDTQ